SARLPVYATRWPTWSEVTDKPSTFPPDAHTHSASDITSGTLSDARLPATIGGDKTFSDNVTVGGTISGNGSGLTNLNASNLSSGTVPSVRLPSTIGGNKTFSNDVTVGGTLAVGGALSWGGGNPIASSDDLWHTGNFDPATKA